MLQSKKTVKYLLGIDAGGTKTDFVLTDCNFNTIKEVTLACANPIDAGIEKALSVFSEGIAYCCKEKDLQEISCFAGIAGGGSESIKSSIADFLSDYNFAYSDNGSDIENCIAMTVGNKNGIVMIMGTGIVAFCQLNKTLHRIGGWGYLLDKGGSGFNIGADAIHCALGLYDKRGGSEILKQSIENKAGISIPAFIPQIYNGGKSLIASFAPLVFDAYRQRDSFAVEIIDRNVREAADLISTAFNIDKTTSLPVFICGGLAHEKEILEPHFRKYIPSADLHFTTDRPVKGAIIKAYNLIETE